MWFKNLQIYRLTESFTLSPEALHEALGERPTRECTSSELSTLGWSAPLGRHGELLTHAASDCIMVCARKVEKVLPAAVVRELLLDKVDQIEQSEGRRVRRREQEELKDELMFDLLPKAFSKSSLTYAYIDRRGGWLVVDASSAKRAEELISLLRETLGSLPVRPLEVAQAPASVMTAWLANQGPSNGYTLQDECELRDPLEEGGVVRCRRQDLQGEEIAAHLEAGKQVMKVALEWNERLGFVLESDLSIKRLKFLDVILEEAADSEADDAASRFDVDFSLMGLELRGFIDQLVETFGGLAEEEDSQAA